MDFAKILAKIDSIESKTQLNESGAKPDFLDLDKDGDRKEPMKSAAKDAEDSKDHDKDDDKLEEAAAPGQEDWIKSNKEKFIKQYGKKKGMEVLYATAWKRSKKKDESAQLEECYSQAMSYDQGMADDRSGMSISSSMDTRTGNKTLTVSAEGSAAENLAQLLKLSGLAAGNYASSEVAEEYANEPNPVVQGMEVQLQQGNDLNRPKKMTPHGYRNGDNPLAMEVSEQTVVDTIEKSLMEELDAIKASPVDRSKIPAAKRKAAGGDWKTTTQDLEREKERNISGAEGLAALKRKTGIAEETKSGTIHKAKPGRYGGYDPETDPDKDEYAEKKPRGRPPKEGGESAAEKEKREKREMTAKELQRWIVGSKPADFDEKEGTGTEYTKMASAEKAVSAYNKMREKGKSHSEALKDAAEKYDISQSTLNRYIEDEKLDEVAPPGKKAKHMVKNIKKGFAKDGKVTPKEESVEQGVAEGSLKEVSKKMLGRYVSKARDDLSSAINHSYRDYEDDEADEKDNKRAEKRQSGIDLARAKINKSGKSGKTTAKVKATEGVAEANVSKYKDLGATNATTHFLKNVTTGKIISPHRSRADADEALQAATNKNKEGHKFTIVRARKQGVAEGSASMDYDKVLQAIAALYGNDIWDNDAMQDLANDLEQAGPTDQELDFIIAKGRLPNRLANTTFSRGDDVQFNEQGVTEDDAALQAFFSKGGKIQQLPYKKPRKADKTNYGSKHIGGGGDKMKVSRTGTAANTQGNKVAGMAEGSSIALKKKLSVTENSFADEFTKFAKGFGKERGINVRTGKPGERTPGPVAANPTLSGSDPENRERLMARYKELKAQFDPAYEYSDDYGFWNKQRAIRDEMQAIKQQLGSDVTESKRNK